jgi:hypothetical protein
MRPRSMAGPEERQYQKLDEDNEFDVDSAGV